MKTLTVNLVPARYTTQIDHWESRSLHCDPDGGEWVHYSMWSKRQGTTVPINFYFVGPRSLGRMHFNGPSVYGPWAAVMPSCSRRGEESALGKQPDSYVDIESGDLLSFHGYTMAFAVIEGNPAQMYEGAILMPGVRSL